MRHYILGSDAEVNRNNMRKNYRYSNEYKFIDFSGFILEKGRKRYRQQKQKLLFSIILDLANCSVKPKRLSETNIKHVESLEKYLREVRGNAESTINNKIYLFVKALNKIGVNVTYTMKSIETKKVNSDTPFQSQRHPLTYHSFIANIFR
jgi:ribosomal protein L14E/L6E/L27E